MWTCTCAGRRRLLPGVHRRAAWIEGHPCGRAAAAAAAGDRHIRHARALRAEGHPGVGAGAGGRRRRQRLWRRQRQIGGPGGGAGAAAAAAAAGRRPLPRVPLPRPLLLHLHHTQNRCGHHRSMWLPRHDAAHIMCHFQIIHDPAPTSRETRTLWPRATLNWRSALAVNQRSAFFATCSRRTQTASNVRRSSHF